MNVRTSNLFRWTKLTAKFVRDVETKDKVVANLLFLEPQDFIVIDIGRKTVQYVNCVQRPI